MRISKTLAALSAVILAVAGLAFAAAPASADQVWYQAYERPTQESPCTAPANETPWQDSFSGQREWTGSWQQWARGGTGGWVCQRAILWAHEADSFIGCHNIESPGFFVQFGSSNTVPPGSPFYTDPACQTAFPGGSSGEWAVFAADVTAAQLICDVVAPGLPALPGSASDPSVFVCSLF